MRTIAPDPLDRTRPPPAAGRVKFRFPNFRRHILPNRFQVVLAPFGQLPLVRAHLLLSGGGEHLVAGQDGLSYLLGGLLDEGTETKTSSEIADLVDGAGGFLHSGADWESLFISAGVMSHQIGPTIELVAEVALHATYPAIEVKRLKSRQLTTQLNMRAQPGVCANEALLSQIYPATCYECPLVGSSASVKAIDRGDLLRFAHRHISPVNSTLIVAGDFNPETMFRQVESLFGEWVGKIPPSAPVLRLPKTSGISVTVLDRPNATQTELRLGHVGLPRAHRDFYASRVMNSILGGKFSSRLNLNLREKHGFTYGISSRFSSRRGSGPFVVGAAVATEHTGEAVGEILGEMQRMQDEPVGLDELQETKSYLQGILPYSLQTIDGLVSKLADIMIHDLPDSYYGDHIESIERIDLESVQEAAQKFLRPNRAIIVAAGPSDTLTEQLSPYGDVRIHEDDTSKP